MKASVKLALNIASEGGLGKYLGLPEHFGRRKKDLFTSLVDRIQQCAASWSNRFLSKAGKLTKLQTVLSTIPTYTMSCFLLSVSLCKRIQSVLTRFWWDGPDNKRKMSWVAWEKLTKPKAGGGLGIRDIQRFNQTLLAKLAWWILTKPNCLLARVLLVKYCQKQSFLDIATPSSCSHGWHGILHDHNLLKSNLGRAIGNDNTTCVWQYSWISLDRNIKPFGPIREEAMDLVVADLLTTDMRWNVKRIEELLPEFTVEIQCLKPSNSVAEDIYVWQPTPSRDNATKSGYFTASMGLHQDPQNSSEMTFNRRRDVWSGNFSPKMRVFLWSIIQGALPLGENLQKRDIIQGSNCPRCNERESAVHCFFTCPFAREVWQHVPLFQAIHIHADTDDIFEQLVTLFRKSTCLPPSGIVYQVLPWIC